MLDYGGYMTVTVQCVYVLALVCFKNLIWSKGSVHVVRESPRDLRVWNLVGYCRWADLEMRESARGLARRKLEPRMYVYISIYVCGFMYRYMMSITGSDVYDV